MIIGIILSLVVWGLVCFCADYERMSSAIITLVVCIILGGVIGTSVQNVNLKKDIEGFTAIKNTYETVLYNKDISGLERLQIVNTAIDQNMMLARRTASIDAWWNVGINKELKTQLKALTPIDS